MLLSQPHNDTMNPSLPPAIQSLYTRQHALQLSNLATNTTAVQETAFNNAFLPLTLLHPLSRGRIALTTRTPLSPPAVNYATLSHPFDATLFAHILRFNRRLLKYPSLLATELVPGSNMTSDQAILDVLPGLVQPTFQHPCCTASMGARDHGGVVDPGSLLVWGVDGVSVVDASVMPVIVGAHLMGTVYGVAEKVCVVSF
jgi:choline dehydrogenase